MRQVEEVREEVCVTRQALAGREDVDSPGERDKAADENSISVAPRSSKFMTGDYAGRSGRLAYLESSLACVRGSNGP
jgi:hypothetical protein